MTQNQINDPKIQPDTYRQQLSPELICQILDNQAKEIQIRATELELQKQEDIHNFEFGKIALDSQIQDRKQQRDHQKKIRLLSYIFVFLINRAVIALTGYALSLNKDAIASEIIKAVCYVMAGGIGGYGIGKSNNIKIKKEDYPDIR